jgi:hypothetical protein
VPEGYYYVNFEHSDYDSWNSFVVHIPPVVADLNQYVADKNIPTDLENISKDDISTSLTLNSQL